MGTSIIIPADLILLRVRYSQHGGRDDTFLRIVREGSDAEWYLKYEHSFVPVSGAAALIMEAASPETLEIEKEGDSND